MVDLKILVEKVLNLLEPQTRAAGIKMHTSFWGKPISINGVSDLLQQVLFNVLLNAMDALEEVEGSLEVWIDIYYEARQVRILVEDSGPGISKDLKEQVFEPFISTKKNGTGLGLAVSYGIIERHKGTMTIVLPRYRQGACFEIVLPVGVESDNG